MDQTPAQNGTLKPKNRFINAAKKASSLPDATSPDAPNGGLKLEVPAASDIPRIPSSPGQGSPSFLSVVNAATSVNKVSKAINTGKMRWVSGITQFFL